MSTLLNVSMAFAVTACLFTAPLCAQETATSPKELAAAMSGSTEKASCCSKESSCEGECPISTAMAALPKMTYKVGDESTCCADSAQAMAKKASTPIHFVVAEKAYTDKSEAMTALVEKTEAMVVAFTTPSVCETSGSTTIAGTSCSCPMSAKKNIELVKAAVDAVHVSYKVGDETCSCPMKAKELAADGAEMKYVIGGEETCCSMTARLTEARAKYKAAVEALTQATAASSDTNS